MFAIVIKDPQGARNWLVQNSIDVNYQRWLKDHHNVSEDHKINAKEFISFEVGRRVEPLREVGDLHAVASVECPNGKPNCRNCGDPKYTEQCIAAGHCSACGVLHGISPDSVINKGFELIQIPDNQVEDGRLKKGLVWNRSNKLFESV